MRFKWDKKYLYWGVTAFLVIAAAMIFYAVLNSENSFFSVLGTMLGGLVNLLIPIAFGFGFAYVLYPIENFFEKSVFLKWFTKRQLKKGDEEADLIRSKKAARVFAIIVTVIVAMLIITGVVIIIIPQLVETVQKLINNSELYVNNIKD